MTETFRLGTGTLAIALLAVAGAAWAEGQDGPMADDAAVRICDAYGPGYQVIPGTNTCIKTGGSVEVDTTATSGGQAPQK